MDLNVTVKVSPASGDLPIPEDWLLASFTPLQLEESLMRACFAPNAPAVSSDVIVLGAPEVAEENDHVREYVRNFVPVFEAASRLRGEKFYLVVLASPVIHLPVYGWFLNRGLSFHVFHGIRYRPKAFRDQLRNALHRFLMSPDAKVKPPAPAGGSGWREGQVPVRMFVMKLEDVCCPGRTDRLCDKTLQALQHLYSRLPAFRYSSYTASVYLATKGPPGSVELACIGYQKRVFITRIPDAFRRHPIGWPF